MLGISFEHYLFIDDGCSLNLELADSRLSSQPTCLGDTMSLSPQGSDDRVGGHHAYPEHWFWESELQPLPWHSNPQLYPLSHLPGPCSLSLNSDFFPVSLKRFLQHPFQSRFTADESLVFFQPRMFLFCLDSCWVTSGFVIIYSLGTLNIPFLFP